MPNSFLTTLIYGRTHVHYIYYIAVDHANSIRSLASSFTSTFVDVSCDNISKFGMAVGRAIVQIQPGPFDVSLNLPVL
jgi:hypothetical protein